MIERTFKDIDEQQIFDADKQYFLTQLGWSDGLTWEALLRSKRILLISEAGSGKTHECREQARLLAAKGEAAFFVELASLASTHLRDLLGYEEETRFDLWLASRAEVATFFLDSYDELQLTRGSFRQALDRFVKGVQGHLGRVRVVITTRPLPFDGQLVRSKLPVPPQIKLQSTEEKEREFASMALGEHIPISSGQSNEEPIPEWRTVALMPLSNPQIVEFAEQKGVKNTAELLSDIERQNAFEFARRPQDLIELCADWQAGLQLRTHRQQVEASIRIKLKPRNREDRHELAELSIDKAIAGASRLALAMWLTRRLTIRHSAKSDNDQQGEAALDPSIILSDWTQEERQTLLERPLFGFASYGRVRFHHRSVSEFLAAKRLQEMRDKGMSLRALKRLLLIETKGNTIVLPSKRAIAGWLAALNDDIFQAIRDHEPTLLLDEGDPASLTLAQRKQALGAYVQRYGKGGWRGLHTPSIQIKRFATPELADVINLLWRQGIDNHEVRCVLLELIERGVIFGCSDLVYSVAMDSALVEVERIYAIHALKALNDPRLGEIAALMVSQHPDWPDKIVREAIFDLFPGHLSVAQLCQSLGWLQWKKRSVSNLSWRLPSLIKNAPLVMSQLEALRDKLVTLISDGLHWRQNQWPHMISSHQYLSSALAATCIRGLDYQCSGQWIHASVLSLRLRQHEYDDDKIHQALAQQINELDSKNRKLVFWAIDALVQSLCPIDDIWKRVVEIIPYDSLIKLTVQPDQAWVVNDLQDKNKPFLERQILMHVALYLLRISPIDLRPQVIDCPDLILYINEMVKPSVFDIKQERARREEAIRNKRRERKKAKNLASWVMLHRELSEYPDTVFSDERCKNLVWNLFRVMISSSGDSNLSGWNRPFLESHFGEVVTDWLRMLFMASWREHCPTLICERPEDQRSTYMEIWRLGLAGLYAEAEDNDWASPLTQEEAMLAARYSLLELNKLPDWINDLVRHHPSAVSEVFGKELEWVLSTSTHELHHSMLLQRLHHAPNSVTMLFVSRLVTWLSEIGLLIDDEPQSSDFMSRYSRVIELILIHGDVDHQAKLCFMAKEYVSKDLAEPVMLIWLSTLIRLSPESGIDVLEEKLRDIEPEPLSKAVIWFTKLFNERHDGINIRNNDFTPELLLRLVRLAYRHVRRQDDAEHEGCYTPDIRDNAEYTRNAILTALLESQGEEGWQVKHDMAIDPLFSHFKDRVLALAQEAWAKEIDSALLDEQQCRELEDKGEAPLTTNAAMFTLLCDRLADLDELLNSDDSPREAWARIDQERIMRRAIAKELKYSANGLYNVDQEAVTAEEKETDIRLRSTASNYESVIELKLGDNRPVRDLLNTIEHKLVTKYLSIETRRSGALLITLKEDRTWRHPDSGATIDINELY
ncbi:ATP-binding protein [Aeromonas jandaei]|uniref:NACHT domain-containing protein n=1 Tax=Aeromonas jandaei TaxID=650 RepID=UPI00191E8E2D|nr:ATP-binding protein [Aeromonas jandaei]MBL0666451.1 ATP-binding protein [Aeromonas jandaei]